MLRIAICDDDAYVIKFIEKYIQNYKERKDVAIEIKSFSSGNVVLESHNLYDLLFLDIEMPGTDGLSVAHRLRQIFCDSLIVFVSSHTEFFREIIEAQPFSFLEKPIAPDDLEKVLDKAIKWVLQKKKFIRFTIHKEDRQFQLSDILYFESAKRQIVLVTKDERFSFYGKISDVEQEVNVPYFFSPHKSFYINYHYIKRISYSHIEMQNGTIIRIPESKRKAVRELYTEVRNMLR